MRIRLAAHPPITKTFSNLATAKAWNEADEVANLDDFPGSLCVIEPPFKE